jgi:hypothetical protein
MIMIAMLSFGQAAEARNPYDTFLNRKVTVPCGSSTTNEFSCPTLGFSRR